MTIESDLTELGVARRKEGQKTMNQREAMAAYTRWWIAHPWHVTGTPESGNVPDDCDCGCKDKS